MLNFGDLTDKIDFEKSYVLGRDGKTKYKFKEFAAGGGYMFDIGLAAGDRTNNRKNLPINLVLKNKKTLTDLEKKNYNIQMRLTDDKGERIYAYAPRKSSMDYSTYTKTTSISLDDKINNLFMKGGLQKDSNNATNQEFFMSEFIANPKSFADSSNLGIIRTQYMGQRAGTASSPTVGGEQIGFTQAFDANLVKYLKPDSQGNIAYVNVLTDIREESPYTHNFGIKKDQINYTKDGKLAYLVIAPKDYKKDGVKVVNIESHDQYTMLSGIYITAIDYIVDKTEFANTFETKLTEDGKKTRKLDYSMMSGWTNPNAKGYTVYETKFPDGYVAKEGDSYLIDASSVPEGGQIMIKIGDSEHAIVRRQQGYYNAYTFEKIGVDQIENIADGVFKFTLREGATVKKGDSMKVYLPYTSDHKGPVSFLSINDGKESTGGKAMFTLQKDRNINMHLYKEGKKGHYVLKYTLADGTKVEKKFEPKGLWQFDNKDKVMFGAQNLLTGPTAGNFYIDTTKLKPGTDITLESYDEKGNKLEEDTPYFKYTNIDKVEKYEGLTWTDHSDTSSILSINKSLYKPYQEIFTNDTVAGSTDDTYKDPRKLVSEEDFKRDTTKIDGYTKYEGGKVRVELEDGKTPKIIKTEADSNEYDDKGNIVGTDQRVDFKFDENGKAYHVFKYQMDLKDATSARSTDQSENKAPKLYKDMKLVFNASDGSSLPSDDVIARVRTRILFNATDGKVEGKDSIVKIAPDNKKFYGEEGYVANGFRGDNVEEGTGDQFVADPTSSNSKLKFLGWVTEDGKKALGDKTTVKSSVFKTLKGDQIFTADTPILRHQIVYAIWTTEEEIPPEPAKTDAEKNPAADPAVTEVKDVTNEKTDDKADHDKEKAKAIVPEVKTPVKDADHLTDEEKAKVAENVKKANPDATNITVDDKGNAKLDYADKSEERIPAKNLIYQVEKGSVAVPAKSDKENEGPVKSKNSDVASARNRQSANVKTGVESINTILVTLGAAISGLVATKRKKEDK